MHDTEIIGRIQQLWRMRQRWHRAEKSLILQGKALCRAWTDGDKEQANELFDMAADGGDADPLVAMALAPFLKAIEEFAPFRNALEKELRKLAKSLPIYSWVASVKGFGDLNLAAMVGECGDIGAYRSHSALWKRMGLAVIGGERQRKKTDADLALLHGYSPPRRAVAYLLSDCLVKGNRDGKYRQLYLARKELEAARVATRGHAHNRAARYMVKRALRDLWSAWRRASCEASVMAITDLPSAGNSVAPSGVVSAISALPNGLGRTADIKNSVAPQGAGRAENQASARTENKTPDHQSPDASQEASRGLFGRASDGHTPAASAPIPETA